MSLSLFTLSIFPKSQKWLAFFLVKSKVIDSIFYVQSTRRVIVPTSALFCGHSSGDKNGTISPSSFVRISCATICLSFSTSTPSGLQCIPYLGILRNWNNTARAFWAHKPLQEYWDKIKLDFRPIQSYTERKFLIAGQTTIRKWNEAWVCLCVCAKERAHSEAE